MKTKQFLPFVVACIAFLFASCGGSGVKPGDFPPMTKTEGDAPFELVAPSSASPAKFLFSSSDAKVATVSGNTVTVLVEGTTTITAQQPSMGSYYPTSTSTILTVKARVCTAPSVRDHGQCVQPCTAPATRQNGECVAPAATGNYVVKSVHTWMPAAFALTWSNANAFCSTSTINGVTGWRLPTEFDLTDIYASGLMNGQGWILDRTWSGTSSEVAGSASPKHSSIHLATGVTTSLMNDDSAYVVCVH